MKKPPRPNVSVPSSGVSSMATGPKCSESMAGPMCQVPRGIGPMFASISMAGLLRPASWPLQAPSATSSPLWESVPLLELKVHIVSATHAHDKQVLASRSDDGLRKKETWRALGRSILDREI